MKSFLKSSLSIFLAITIIFSSAYVGFGEVDFDRLFAVKVAAASSGTCGDNLTWTLNDEGTLTISGEGAMVYYEVVPWYDMSSKVEKIIISNGVTSISDYAFYNCTNLTSIEIPDSVTRIGFSSLCMSSLASIYITDIASWCRISLEEPLSYTGNLYLNGNLVTDIVIPDSVTWIGDYVFSNCTSIESIEIPDSVTSIGYWSFFDCTSLESIEIPDGVTSIGYSTFFGCTSLTSIEIPDSVTYIGDSAFGNCTSLTSVTLGKGVEGIGSFAFSDCTNLASINIDSENTKYASVDGVLFNKDKTQLICYPNGKAAAPYEVPDSVTSIGGGTFSGCTSLTSITLGKGVGSISYRAFSDCTNLASINIDSENTKYASVDGVLFNKDKTQLICCPEGKVSETYVIPDSVTSIGEYAFSGCTNIASVIIGEGITSIGNYAFSGFNGLTSIEIPDNVTYIWDGAFHECTSLATVTIGDSVTTIGEEAFYNCESLESIEIPDSVTSIGDRVFYECTSLTSITLGKGVEGIGSFAFYHCSSHTSINVDSDNQYYASVDGVLFNKDKTQLICYPNGKAAAPYEIPDSVTSIGEYAFSGCTSLTSVIIGEGITSIGDCAFSGFTGLASIEIPDNVTSIGEYAFSGCTSLISIEIPDNVTYIWDGAFRECTSLESITLSDSLTSISDGAFVNCKSLKSIVIPDSVKYIGYESFIYCKSLKSVTIGNSVKYIDENAFHECTSLESVTLGNSVTGIYYYAFSGCISLTSIVIPASVTKIGEGVFDCCYNLEYVFYAGSESDWNAISINGYGNDALTEAIIHFNSTGHNYGEWIIDENATCTTDGSKHIECTVCGITLETAIIPATGHTASDWKITADSTCTEAGSKYKECTVCGITVETDVISAKGHTEVIDAAVEPTCTTVGKTEGSHCSFCGEVIKAQTTIAAKGHNSSSWITDKKATTSAAGKKHKECTKCGKVLETATIKQLTCSNPGIKSASNSGKNVKVTWNSVSGADYYYVYRKISGGSYSYIGKTTKTSFTDEKASAGKTYTYKVRAKNEVGYSDYSSTKTVKHLDQPSIKTPENITSGVKISWSKVSGASGYKVYRKTSDGWKYLGKTSKTYFTDKTAKSGKKYTYTVKAYSGDYNSSYSSTGVSIYHLADPTLKTPSSTSKGIVLKWNKITGAQGYVIYRKTGSGSYSKIATVKGNSKVTYTDKKAKKGKKYTYKIKAYYSKTYSAYSSTKTITDKY